MVLKSRVLAPDWSASEDPANEAKCRKHPLPTNHEVNAETDPFFYAEEEAAHICNGTYDTRICPFRSVCLHRALVNNEQAGTFGGLTTEQRRWVRRNDDLIGRDEWDESDRWRWTVPSPEYFEDTYEEGDEGDSEEDSQEHTA